MTSRVYVYQPLVWRPRGTDSTVPLSAFLRGPTRGTISSAVFDRVCPANEITHIVLGVEYQHIWEHAIEALSGEERCVVVDDWILSWKYVAFGFLVVISSLLKRKCGFQLPCIYSPSFSVAIFSKLPCKSLRMGWCRAGHSGSSAFQAWPTL